MSIQLEVGQLGYKGNYTNMLTSATSRSTSSSATAFLRVRAFLNYQQAMLVYGFRAFDIEAPHFHFVDYGEYRTNAHPTRRMYFKSFADADSFCSKMSLWHGYNITEVL